MTTVDRFVEGLKAIPEEAFTIPEVAHYLEVTPVDPASLAPYLRYQPTHYTRNLIYTCALFDLIAVCWEVGQASAIHNHQGQRCWMAVPVGRLAIQNYEVVRAD